ncbi:DUF1127 domain-containing protein [Bradyrhizobium sp. AUGA SZCCT0176]|uniref:DUF1127 domain-containing protein n=1 Tax=Bradyrhizobium sp. AUGA SZCCT0176 TaxID=2807664 RepID=UPI00289A315D|nr:DUF1127 domain-containing protein [Bradyrhizobium sp. AUGA SZCCT0176]
MSTTTRPCASACSGRFRRSGSLRADALSSVCAGDRHQQRHVRTSLRSTRAVIAAIIALVRVWRERRRSRRQLSVMSARELEDIGLCRPELGGEIGKPFWRK